MARFFRHLWWLINPNAFRRWAREEAIRSLLISIDVALSEGRIDDARSDLHTLSQYVLSQ